MSSFRPARAPREASASISRFTSALLFTLALAGLIAGCSGDPAPSGVDAGPVGGFVSGAVDDHCALPDAGTLVQETSPEQCTPDAGADPGEADGGEAEDDGSDYGPTRFNALANDDDCKFHVQVAATPIREDQDVTFTVTATNLGDGTPVVGAGTDAEVFLGETHPAPNSNQTSAEPSPGVYRVGPVRFDQPGRWTVRFHLNETCSDASEESPHAHVAFFVDVP